jgi:CRP/FNR family cyclic AMP-dependent transcriptional regulator
VARSADEYLKQLAKVPMFRALSKRDLALVRRNAENHKIGAGENLVKEGGRGHEFFIIVDGKASIRRKGKKVGSLGPGDYFGELALLDPAPRNATVTADNDMEVLILNEREFSGLLAEVPSLSRKVLTGMARRLHEADSKIVY